MYTLFLEKMKFLLLQLRKSVLFFENFLDGEYLDKKVKQPKLVNHDKWQAFLLANFNKQGYKILEIGSREVTGKSTFRSDFTKAEYFGFDFYEGKNVDVIGDAHQLSKYFPNQQFDLIFSSACFEHFAMPWLVAEEISKLLRVGGHVFIETHFSFSYHEHPWNFFQFSDKGLSVLFNAHLGFETIETGMSNPIVGRFSKFSSKYLINTPVKSLYCHSEILAEKVSEVGNFTWQNCDLNVLVGNTLYPKEQ